MKVMDGSCGWRFLSFRKNGQVTIFVIAGFVVMFSVLIIWLLSGGAEVASEVSSDPRDIVRGCVEDVLEESINRVMLNGGEVVPSLAISYNGSEWNYLCHNVNYYLTCYNIHPMLEASFEAEVVADTVERVQGCFDLMREEYEEMGYEVSGGTTGYSVDLLPGFVNVVLDKDVVISGDDERLEFSDFGLEVASEVYGLIEVARLIVNDEAQYCNFEYGWYMLFYPEFDISRVDYKESKLYSVMNRGSGEEFRFAVRSCALPPGV